MKKLTPAQLAERERLRKLGVVIVDGSQNGGRNPKTIYRSKK